jgi:hypothetical protein
LQLTELVNIGNQLRNSFPLDTKKDFLNDCVTQNCGGEAGCTPLKDNLVNLKLGHIINGWHLFYEKVPTNQNPRDRQNFTMLETINNIYDNSTKMTFLRKVNNGKAEPFFVNYFTKHYEATLNYTSIGKNKRVYLRSVELNNLDNFLNKYTGSNDESVGYIKEMLQSDKKFTGGSWGLGLLNMNPRPAPLDGRINGFEDKINSDDNAEDNHRFDIRVGAINVETKNWADYFRVNYYNGTKESSFKTQLYSYFSVANNMTEFVYFFKKRNTTDDATDLANLKNKFQTLFQTTIKDNDGNDVNALFDFLSNSQKGNIGLLRKLATENGIPSTLEILDNPALFKQKVIDDTSSTLYNFIKIKSDI